MKRFYYCALFVALLVCMASCEGSNPLDGPDGPTGVIHNSHKGHEWVDMGLPSGNKWAIMNIGATDTLDAGLHFAFGSTISKEELLESGEYEMSFASTLSEDVLSSIAGTDNDVAHVRWGGNWRMPTREDYEELFMHCFYHYKVINEKGGYLFKARNGNRLFLPNTGHYIGLEYSPGGVHNGYYWTATRTIELRFFKSKEIVLKSGDAFHGMAVRAICN